MKDEDKILDRYGNQGPWRVPEGYFESVRIEIASKLPEYPMPQKPEKLTVWQRLKPYVYLAAMFAGIWLMMKTFHNVSGMDRLNIDNPPTQIAAYMGDPEVSDAYVLPSALSSSLSDEELLDEVSDQYESFEDFERDFYATINSKDDHLID